MSKIIGEDLVKMGRQMKQKEVYIREVEKEIRAKREIICHSISEISTFSREILGKKFP